MEYPTIVPEYYSLFECIADRCTHSCCKGWIIEIDEQTLDYYKSLKGDMGDRLRSSVSREGTFILREDDRCPFLTEKGLCDIITHLGSDALCNICSDHPRFRNFYTNFCEEGLGLSCEEAARVILSFEPPFVMESHHADLTPSEEGFFKVRNRVFDLLQDRSKTIFRRIAELCREYGFESDDICLSELADRYSKLEILDSSWLSLLCRLRDFKFTGQIFKIWEFSLPFEQLLCYFVFRHFARSPGDYYSPVYFAVTSCYIIGALMEMHISECGSIAPENLYEYARMYSSEIEYSDENMNHLFDSY